MVYENTRITMRMTALHSRQLAPMHDEHNFHKILRGQPAKFQSVIFQSCKFNYPYNKVHLLSLCAYSILLLNVLSIQNALE